MAMVKPVIFQIVGYQNSGKTTFLEKILSEMQKIQLKTITIKHHGHGGKPEVAKDKDSTRHLQSGAMVSIVEGDGLLVLESLKENWSLQEKVELASFFQPDCILIEGHKFVSFPKAVLLRNRDDISLVDQLKEIKVVFVWDKTMVMELKDTSFPIFYLNDKEGIAWLITYLQKEIGK